jgi:hypothetical protein
LTLNFANIELIGGIQRTVVSGSLKECLRAREGNHCRVLALLLIVVVSLYALPLKISQLLT